MTTEQMDLLGRGLRIKYGTGAMGFTGQDYDVTFDQLDPETQARLRPGITAGSGVITDYGAYKGQVSLKPVRQAGQFVAPQTDQERATAYNNKAAEAWLAQRASGLARSEQETQASLRTNALADAMGASRQIPADVAYKYTQVGKDPREFLRDKLAMSSDSEKLKVLSSLSPEMLPESGAKTLGRLKSSEEEHIAALAKAKEDSFNNEADSYNRDIQRGNITFREVQGPNGPMHIPFRKIKTKDATTGEVIQSEEKLSPYELQYFTKGVESGRILDPRKAFGSSSATQPVASVTAPASKFVTPQTNVDPALAARTATSNFLGKTVPDFAWNRAVDFENALGDAANAGTTIENLIRGGVNNTAKFLTGNPQDAVGYRSKFAPSTDYVMGGQNPRLKYQDRLTDILSNILY